MKTIVALISLFLVVKSFAQPGGKPAIPVKGDAAKVDAAKPPVAPAEPSYNFGTPYTDAGTLVNTILPGNQWRSAIKLLVYYGKLNVTDDTDKLYNDLSSFVKSNIYLNEVITPDALKSIQQSLADAKAKKRDVDSLLNSSSVGAQNAFGQMFSAQKIGDGLGTFIAERFKEELTIRYLQAFHTALTANDPVDHYSIIFPKTYLILLQYDNVFDYKSLLTTLKESFKEDLQNLDKNAIPFIKAFQKDGKLKIPHFYEFAYVADYLLNELAKGKSPLSIFQPLNAIPDADKMDANFTAAIVFNYHLIQGLANNAGTPLGSDALLDLIQNKQGRFTAFAGLFIESKKTELTALNTTIPDPDRKGAPLGANVYSLLNSGTVKDRVEDITTMVHSVMDITAGFEVYKNSEHKMADLVVVVRATSTGSKKIISALHLHNPAYLKAFGIVDHLVNITEDVTQDKYGLIVSETLSILDTLSLNNTGFYKTFKKYGMFISNVAQAQDAQGVQDALEVAALPVGSYQIKRNALRDISLNAYAGFFAGAEFLNQSKATNVNSQAGIMGFTAPVGLAFSWGSRSCSKPSGNFSASYQVGTTTKYLTGVSWTTFISIIDVGAISAYRLTNDASQKLPDFTWSNILAPGLGEIVGFKNSPLSLGFIGQLGPQLRSISNSTTADISASNWSFRVFLAVDIPVFSFYSKTAK